AVLDEAAVGASPEVEPAIDAPVVAPAASSARRTWPGRASWFAIAAGASFAILLAARFAVSTHPLSIPSPGATTAVVLPFRVAAAASDTWLRLGAMDLVADRLRAGGLAVPPSETTVAVIQDTHDGTSTAAIRRVTPAALVVDGEIARANGTWTVSLHTLAADGAA